MTSNEFKTKAAKAIDNGHLGEAIELLRSLPQSDLPYDLRSAVERAAEHYRYMLRYFADGVSDPGRRDSYDDLRADLRTIVDRAYRCMMVRDTPTLYYNTLRTLGLHPERSIAAIAAEMDVARGRVAASFDVSGVDAQADEARRQLRGLGKELFDRVWTTFPLDKASAEAIDRMLGPDSGADHATRMQLIAAVGLGLLEFYDSARIATLAEVLDCTESDDEASAATTWLLIAMFRYRKRRHPRGVRARLAAASEHPLWPRRVREVYLELLRARDTERVVNRVRDEIMPDIIRLGKDIMDNDSGKIGLPDITDGVDINPEWEERMRESGVFDRMKEFSELSAEGADIFMGAFSHLKNYPFFSDVAAWFTPFDDAQPAVSEALSGDMASFVELLCRMPMPCDNDKYSILFTVMATPAGQREMMARQLDQQRAAMESAGMNGAYQRAGARNYVQNIYRFFKLFGRRNEFFDPFARKFFLGGIDVADSALRDADTLRAMAELLLRIEAWDDARAAYEMLESVAEPSAEIYQKKGYCHEQLRHYGEAAECYSYADLMDGTSAWTLRRLGACLRRSGQPERASEVLERLCRMQPDVESSALNLAYARIEAGHYADALRQLAAVEVMGAAPRKLNRPMAWSAFMSGDFETARRKYREVLDDAPDGSDYLNMGHLAWVEGRIADAITLYRRAMDASGLDLAGLEKAIRADMASIAPLGADPTELPLLLDALRLL